MSGLLVDAVIMPVAPHAAVIPGKYYHTGEFSDVHANSQIFRVIDEQ